MRFATLTAALVAGIASSAPAAVTVYSWENTTHDFRVGQAADSPFVTVQNSDAWGITEGTWSAEAATGATTNFVRGPWSSAVADALEGRSVATVDFAVKNPSSTTTQNVIFSIIIAARNVSTGAPLFTVETPSDQRVRAQKGSVSIDFGALDPRLTEGVLEARIEFRVSRQGGFTGSYYFDNFRVEDVPEPASLALLAGGGAFFLLRRRA